MSETRSTSKTRSPAYPPQTLNLVCRRCGYRLRGLSLEAKCPECGLDVAETLADREGYRRRLLKRARRLAGPRLVHSDRAWLRAITAGAVTLFLSLLCLIAWHLHRQSLPVSSKRPDYLLVPVSAGFLLACWLLAWPERRHEPVSPAPAGALVKGETVRWRRIRLALRLISLAAPVAAVIALVSELVPWWDHPFYARLALVPACLVPVVIFLLFDLLTHVAVRAQDHLAAVAFRITRQAMAIFAALVVGVGVIEVRRVAEITASGVAALFAYGGLGLVWYGAVCLLLIRLAWRAGRAALAPASIAPSKAPESTTVAAGG
jgi:hypothetical protein